MQTDVLGSTGTPLASLVYHLKLLTFSALLPAPAFAVLLILFTAPDLAYIKQMPRKCGFVLDVLLTVSCCSDLLCTGLDKTANSISGVPR